MKFKISMLFMSLIATFLLGSCSEDDSDFNGPYRLNVVGPGSVRPEATVDYTLGDFANPESYSWTVEGPASIVGSATGNTITVEFGAVGDVVISVTDGTDENGQLAVEVAETEPVVTVYYEGTGVLQEGEEGKVFFKFNAPLKADPTFEVNTDSSGFVADALAFESGTLGEYQEIVADSGYAVYTAGMGNGTPEALFQDIISSTTYGEVKIDSAFVKLYRVDNIAPLAELSYSSNSVQDSTVVTVTATFSEEMIYEDPAMDSSIFISFSGGGVMAQTDTLKATDDPLVYTYDYTVNGEGNGTVNVSFVNAVDLAGHDIAEVSNSSFTVDNEEPNIILNTATANGDGIVEVQITSDESGTGWYLILEDGADKPEADAFDTSSNGIALTALSASSKTITVAQGEYDVYFMVSDEAGNYSDVSSAEDLTVN